MEESRKAFLEKSDAMQVCSKHFELIRIITASSSMGISIYMYILYTIILLSLASKFKHHIKIEMLSSIEKL